MNMDSSHDLTGVQLAKLLGLATDRAPQEAENGSPEQTARMLQDRLAGPLPMKTEIAEQLPVLLGKLQRGLLPGDGLPIGQLLLDSEATLETLKAVKNYGKQLARREGSQSDHAVGIAIYYTAIASAIVFHNERITRHSFEYLLDSFSDLTERPWMPTDLARHLTKAGKKCQKKA